MKDVCKKTKNDTNIAVLGKNKRTGEITHIFI